MKKLLTIVLSVLTVNAFGFGINLQESGKMSVDKLIEMGAEHVRCEQAAPKCILKESAIGIQYVGQRLDDVELTPFSSATRAIKKLQELKSSGLCN